VTDAWSEFRARLPKRIIWSPQPGPQYALIDCPLTEIFFGGARGGGKTDGILGKWALREQRLGSNFNAVGLRPTSISWDDAVERSKSIFGPLGGKFNETKLTWRMPRGGRARFAYLERVSDADQYQGKNVTDVWIEEAGLYPTSVAAGFLPRPIARMKAVLRAPRGITVQMILSGNPGGPGQHWLSSRYGLIPFPGQPKVVTVRSEAGEVTKAAVIPSRVEDNHMIDQAAYVSNLRQAGSEQLVRAWLRGDWSAVEGAFFDCWDERRHVIEPFTPPAHWLRFVSMDWGFAAPHSIGWWAVASDPTLGGHIPRGAMVRYREWYGAGGARLPAESLARGILDREAAAGERRGDAADDEAVISYGVLDPSAFDVSRGPSIAEQMARVGVVFRRADNRRVRSGGSISGWDQMRGRMLGDMDGNSMIFCTADCQDSVRTIPVLQHDPDKAEDLDTTAEDHAADDWRYGCMSRPWVRPLPDRPDQRILEVGPGNQVTLDDLWEDRKGRHERRI
jgi:hypothetical protein